MTAPPDALMQSPAEEFLNTLTHGIGAIAALAGGIVLITLAALHGDVWQLLSSGIFAVTLVLLYVASTLFHAVRGAAAKARLKVLDHCAIFLLIAGTYTPFTLGPLRGAWGWTLFGIVWALATVGIVFKLFFTGRFRLLSTLLYLALGWMVVVAYVPMTQQLATTTLLWLVAGGLSYTVGTPFYMSRRIPYAHGIWHLFVLGGSACHYAAVCLEILV